MNKPPLILDTQTVAQSKLFQVEAVSLKFSNGEQRTFERLSSGGRNTVMVIPIQDEHLLMVREYAVGREAYELGFVKGMVDAGETPEKAANRELQEEIGFVADSLQALRSVSIAPHYNRMTCDIFIARDLTPNKLEGDEPEALLIERWPLSRIPELLKHPDISDARSLFALSMLRSITALHI